MKLSEMQKNELEDLEEVIVEKIKEQLDLEITELPGTNLNTGESSLSLRFSLMMGDETISTKKISVK